MGNPDLIRVFRVQDADGRGPFRPGFSKEWVDADFSAGMLALPTFMEEFGADVIDRLGRPGEYFGAGVRSADRLSAWFSAAEQGRLRTLGFQVVHMRGRVMAESENQIIFARRAPLRNGAVVVPWPGG